MRVENMFERIGVKSSIARMLNLRFGNLDQEGEYEGRTYAERLDNWTATLDHNNLHEPNMYEAPSLLNNETVRIFGRHADPHVKVDHFSESLWFNIVVMRRNQEFRVVLFSEASEYEEQGWHQWRGAVEVLVHPQMIVPSHERALWNTRLLFSVRSPEINTRRLGGYWHNQYTHTFSAPTIRIDPQESPFDRWDYTSFILAGTATVRREILNLIRAQWPAVQGASAGWLHETVDYPLAQDELDTATFKEVEFSPRLHFVVSTLVLGGVAYALSLTPNGYGPQRVREFLNVVESFGIDNPVWIGNSRPISKDRIPGAGGSNTCVLCSSREIARTIEVLEGNNMRADEWTSRIAQLRICGYCTGFVDNCNTCGLSYNTLSPQAVGHEAPAERKCHRCQYSGRRRVRILNYSHRPTFRFHETDLESTTVRRRDKLFMGIEIEMETNPDFYSVRRATTEWLPDLPLGVNGDDSFFYAKSDSSLSHGFELCTHPFTPDWAYENFPFEYFDEAVENELFLESPRSAGQHIHVSRTSFTPRHLARFLGLHGFADKFVQSIGGRPSTNYAEWRDDVISWVKDKDAVEMNAGVYASGRTALNLNRTDTIELRYPQGVASGKLIRKNIEWVDAVYSFTKTLDDDHYHLVEDPGYLMFWIASHPERYSNLQSYIDNLFPRPKPFELERSE